MRNKNEILDYLHLEETADNMDTVAEVLKAAEDIETTYQAELAAQTHGYGLYCDVFSSPHALEELGEGDYLEPLNVSDDEIPGVIVYQIIRQSI